MLQKVYELRRASMHKNPDILFVCEHGAAKSIIAATYFNLLAKQRGFPWRAIARGTNPELRISDQTMLG
jgi:arsenate reductase (thioredoxin)